MKTFFKLGLALLIAFVPFVSVNAQQPDQSTTAPSGTSVKVTVPADANSPATPANTIVLSGTASTARIADPNEPVVFTGRVMRMADYVAAMSASTAAEQHLHIQEMHNRETNPPTQPSPPRGSN